MNVLQNTLADADVPVTRLQLRPSATGHKLQGVTEKQLFLKGPISLEWLGAAAGLPGKSLSVALAIQWLTGMSANAPVKLTAKALRIFHVSDDAASDGIKRLEGEGLVSVDRRPGQRPIITVKRR